MQSRAAGSESNSEAFAAHTNHHIYDCPVALIARMDKSHMRRRACSDDLAPRKVVSSGSRHKQQCLHIKGRMAVMAIYNIAPFFPRK
jgi:hypothetical protein